MINDCSFLQSKICNNLLLLWNLYIMASEQTGQKWTFCTGQRCSGLADQVGFQVGPIRCFLQAVWTDPNLCYNGLDRYIILLLKIDPLHIVYIHLSAQPKNILYNVKSDSISQMSNSTVLRFRSTMSWTLFYWRSRTTSSN